MTQHILVTGGAGFIGSHLTARLLARGDRVTVMDDFNDFYDPVRKRSNVAPFLERGDYNLYRIDAEADLDGQPIEEAIAGLSPAMLPPQDRSPGLVSVLLDEPAGLLLHARIRDRREDQEGPARRVQQDARWRPALSRPGEQPFRDVAEVVSHGKRRPELPENRISGSGHGREADPDPEHVHTASLGQAVPTLDQSPVPAAVLRLKQPHQRRAFDAIDGGMGSREGAILAEAHRGQGREERGCREKQTRSCEARADQLQRLGAQPM